MRQRPRGGLLRGGARGAALGAVGGAIVVSIDPASRLLTVKGTNGASIRPEVRDAKKLEEVRAGDRLLVR
jgi:hypothetical protein